MRPRVFVSSVIEGFEEYREAARQAIEEAGMEPVLVNEDFPSLSISPRNACLDAVDSSDVFLAVVDLRGGWRAPSGKLVVEEEFERAQQRKIPIFAFLREGLPDTGAQAFSRMISDFVEGHFRKKFSSIDDLRDKIRAALAHIERGISSPGKSMAKIEELLSKPWTVPHKASLRIAFVPEREEEVFSPTLVDSEDFKADVLRIGHSQGVTLFDHGLPKRVVVCSESMVIEQIDPQSNNRYSEEVRVEIGESGFVVVDANVVGRVDRSEGPTLLDMMVLAEEDVEVALRKAFSFASALYGHFDKYKRHCGFSINAALSDIGYRRLVRNPKPQPRYTRKLFGIEHVVKATDSPRRISRSDLEQPNEEIARLISRFHRAIKANESSF